MCKLRSVDLDRSTSMKVALQLNEPEIVLVTNMKSPDVDAILLGMKLTFNYDMIPDNSKQLVGSLQKTIWFAIAMTRLCLV